jgi:hypothetical protein
MSKIDLVTLTFVFVTTNIYIRIMMSRSNKGILFFKFTKISYKSSKGEFILRRLLYCFVNTCKMKKKAHFSLRNGLSKL